MISCLKILDSEYSYTSPEKKQNGSNKYLNKSNLIRINKIKTRFKNIAIYSF